MTLKSYAKINLGLRILKKRADGFHDLETVFREIALFDEIELQSADAIEFETSHPQLSSSHENLCVRSAELLRQQSGVSNGVRMVLKKNIPIGAGLGGGSSNATTVLRGLNQLWNLQFSNEKLRSFASELGSDAPFFVEGGTAHATGRGELLNKFLLPLPYWIVTVTPPVHVSTPWAYRALNWSKVLTPIGLSQQWLHYSPTSLGQLLQNDFEPVVFYGFPEIKSVYDAIQGSGSIATSMSGSGSTIFGFYESEAAAISTALRLKPLGIVSITSPDFSR